MSVALALEAMATRFELWLDGDDPRRLRAAGEEALDEVSLAEDRLSRYRPTSEIAWVNARAGGEPVPVSPPVLRLLARCADLARLTDGAFDVTVGPLLRAWGFMGGGGALPSPAERDRARSLVGTDGLELDEAAGTARLARAGMELDLGAVGKGYALDRAVAVLVEHRVPSAILHGGTSSVHVVGRPPSGAPWRVAWRRPDAEPALRVLDARRPALSISAAHGKGFWAGRGWYGHVLDPRLGEPALAAASACVTGPSSLVCDALSTALLVCGEAWRAELAARFPGYEGWTAPIAEARKEAS